MKTLFLILSLGSQIALAQNLAATGANPASSRGETNLRREILQRPDLDLLHQLKASGVWTIQGKPIEQFIEDSARNEFHIQSEGETIFQNADGSVRKSARYLVKRDGQHKVEINLAEAQKALGSSARGGLQGHETFGSIDRNFAPSSMIQEALRLNQLRNLPPALMQKLFNIDNSKEFQVAGGGTSGVGGGGDHRVKHHVDSLSVLLFRKLLNGLLTPTELVEIYCFMVRNIEFEIDPTLSIGQYRHNLETEKNSRFWNVIFFPESNFGSRDPEQQLNDFRKMHPVYLQLIDVFHRASPGSCG